jgi:hypothetical protein
VAERSSIASPLARQGLQCLGEAYLVSVAVLTVAVLLNKTGPPAIAAALLLMPVAFVFGALAVRSGTTFLRTARTRSVRATVGRALGTLGTEYRMLARLCITPGREDHVAIGPNGIFVIVSCDDGGRVTASQRRLFVNAQLPWRDLVDDTRVDALRVRERVRRSVGRPLPVHSVLCFARALVAVGQEIQGVKIVHASRLARLIASTALGSAPLSAADIDAAAKALTTSVDSRRARPVLRFARRGRGVATDARRLALVGRRPARQTDVS